MVKDKTKKTKEASKQVDADKNYLEFVQDQYLDYPYPLRNPEDEKTRLLMTQGEHLGEINHYLYKGKRNLLNTGFRVLIAGGGTGDASSYFAEQLRDSDAEIVYLDFSKASMEIAQQRAEVRGLKDKITWINDSLLNIPHLGLGKFDYINCSGVLHHLASPDEGLKILSDATKDDGAVTVMVYALYGRTGVYQIQELMRMVNKGVTNRKKEVANGWTIVNALPVTNWYSRGKDLLGDHLSHGDAGMYDMFLHKQDRAYTIPQFYEFISKAGLNLVEFCDPYVRACLNIDSYISDPELNGKLKLMSIEEQHAMCEILCGNIIKHTAYLSKKKDTMATLDELTNVPYFYAAQQSADTIYTSLESNPHLVGQMVKFELSMGNSKVDVQLPVSPYTKYIFKYLDGKRTLNEIFAEIKESFGGDVLESTLFTEAKKVLTPFITCGVLLLKDKSIPDYKIKMDPLT